MQNPCLFLLLLYMSCFCFGQNFSGTKVDVGLILDTDSVVGKMSQTSIYMGLEDFYEKHNDYKTRIVLHTRDSKSDVVEAASAAIDLLKNVQVQAILGPQLSTQADFVINIGNKTRVPILSSATSPFLSPIDNPYFVRVAQNSSSQLKALTAIIKAFNWHDVVLIYEDSQYGNSLVSHLTDSLLKINTQVGCRTAISISATDDVIRQELYRLKTMQTRVFILHMTPPIASRVFLKAKEVGMMKKEYAWIVTDGLTSFLDSLDPEVVESMQGVLGVKPYVPRSNGLDIVKRRWRRRFLQENPEIDRCELNVFGLWAYDSATALAMAIENAGIGESRFKKPRNGANLTDLAAIGTSEMGSNLLQSVNNIRFEGLSGEFRVLDGELKSSAFQIINVIGKGEKEIGFWTSEHGLSKTLMAKTSYSVEKEDLGAIIWPGDSNFAPKGWEVPTGETELRIGVPAKGGFGEFVKVEYDPQTSDPIVTGFCVDVFKEVIHSLPYAVPYKFFPFETSDGTTNYDDLVNQISLGKVDAIVGDITIVLNRSQYVDFTLPFTESGVSMIVPIQDDKSKNGWIFMKPLTKDLWITTGVFFVFTGFVVWVLEHRVNKEFRGPPRKQVGMIFWYSFSTLVFAHNQKLISNLSRFVVIVWVFVVLVLTTSYTASLTSMLTVQKLEPTVTSLDDLVKNGEYIGTQQASFVDGFLKSKLDSTKLKHLATLQEYDEALTKGSKNGGVSAIVDELPYLKLFLSKNCDKYTMVGPTYKTAGFGFSKNGGVSAIVDELPYLKLFLSKNCDKYTMVGPTYKTAGIGFAFPKGSPLVPDVSRAILSVTESDNMMNIRRKWLGDETECSKQTGAKVTTRNLTLSSFTGLFIIAGVSSLLALLIFLCLFLFHNRDILTSNGSVWQKISAMAKCFDQVKESSLDASKKRDEDVVVPQGSVGDFPQSPVSISHDNADQGISITEPGTPDCDIVIEIVENRN